MVLMLSVCHAAPAAATTVGGSSVSALGGFVLSKGQLRLPAYSSVYRGEEFEPALDTTSEVGVESFGPGARGWSSLALEDSSEPNFVGGVPAIAASATAIAAAWVSGSRLLSEQLGGSAAGPPTTHPTQGKVGAFDIALGPGGARAVSWSDDSGTQIQVVSALGVSSPPAQVSPTTAAAVTVTADGAGGWWVVTLAARELTAIDMSEAGFAGPPLPLPYTARARPPSHLLAQRSWLAIADGRGGLWIGLPHALIHATATGQVRTVARTGLVALASGDDVSALVEESGRAVVVRTVGASLGPPIRLPDAGVVIDVAFDAARKVIVLLTGEGAGGVVALREISTSGHVRRSQALPECRGRQYGQVEASGGLIAVSCTGARSETENAGCGGCSRDGRTNRYILLRGGRELGSHSYFEGSEGF